MEPPSTFNELLINEVKSHPSLYDQQQRVCTDNGERNVIWEVIAQRIDKTINGEFAKKRWLQVRDRYRKELKMALKTSVQPKWPYFSKLNWLDPYLKDAKSIKAESNSPPAAIRQSTNSEIGRIKSDFQSISYYEKDQPEHQHFQFPQYQTVNLLETLMAASRDLLEKHREKCATEMDHQQNSQSAGNNQLELFFSPDSAIASTSEENAEQFQFERNFEGNDNDDLQELFVNGKKRADQNEDKISSLTKLINQRLPQGNPSSLLMTNTATTTQLDFNSLLNSPSRIANSFANFPTTPPAPQLSNRFCRSRNQPPYLVRRGNKQQQTQKSKSESNSSNSSPLKLDMDASSICSSAINKNGNELAGQLPTAEEWTRMDLNNDEDLLFARLVVARLKKFEAKKRREIRFAIHKLLDKSEEEMEMIETGNGEQEDGGGE